MRAVVAFMLLWPAVAPAYRPFVSTDAAVADPGEVEVEFGYAGFRERDGRTAVVAPAVIGNLGLARGLELVGEFKVVNDVGRNGTRFEDSAVSLKWVAREGVLQERGVSPSVAVEVSLLVPTVRGEGTPGTEVTGIVSGRAWGWTCHLNGGALIEPGASELGPVWGVILERPLVGPVRAVAEVNGESATGNGADNGALVGAVWAVDAPPPLHELSLDVGVRHGISRDADEWGGTAGFTVAFPW